MKDSRSKHLGKMLLLAVLAVAVIALGLIFRRKPPSSLYRETHLLMGTYITVEVRSCDPRTASQSIEDAFRSIARVEELMSTYDPESRVSLLNERAWQGPVRVDPVLFSILEKSLDVSRISGGGFDITVKPILDLWKSHAQTGSIPPEQEVRQARQFVSSTFIELKEPFEVTFKKRGVRIDLGGIAKGFAADIAVERLKAHGVSAGLVEAGGDIRLFGGTSEEPWRIAVQNPFSEETLLPFTIVIEEGAVVTSGNYRRGYLIGGKWYSHIIDPRSGFPADVVPSVTVVAPDAAFADGLATALSVLGLEKSFELVSNIEGVECLFVTGDEKRPVVTYSPGFKDYLDGAVADGIFLREARIAP